MAVFRNLLRHLPSPYLLQDIVLVSLLLSAGFYLNKLINLQQIDSHLNQIYQEVELKTELVTEMQKISLQRLLILHQMALKKNVFERENLYARFQMFGGKFISLRLRFESLELSRIEKQHLNENRNLFRVLSIQRAEIANKLISGEDQQGKNSVRSLTNYNEILIGLNKLLIAQSYRIRLAKVSAEEQKQQAYWQFGPLGKGIFILNFFIAIQIMLRHAQIRRKTRRLKQNFRQKIQLKERTLNALNYKLEQSNTELKEEVVYLRQEMTKLRQANLVSEAASRFKGEFLANMSHEIRTPLNAVIGMTTLLRETQLSPVQQDYVDTINNSSDALLALINDILDFSKINAGKLELEHAPFSLFTCVEAAVDLVTSKAVEKHLEILVFFDPNIPAEVWGDMARLRQVLINLLSNAVKFTAEGEITVLVQSRYRADKHQVELEITIKDTGIGLPPEKIEHLFESFNQLDTSITRNYGGTGLGLTISKQLVALMGGKIWVDSELEKGSAFHFTVHVDTKQMHPEAYLQQPHTLLQGKKLLVVEGNLNNQRLIQGYTSIWGLNCDMVAQGGQALELLAKQRYDGVIVDMEITDMHGLMLCQQIHTQAPKTPVLLLVSLGSLAWQEEDNRHLFRLHLHKPIKVRHLFTALQNLLKTPKPQLFRADKTAISPGIQSPVKTATPQETPPALRILMAEDNLVNQKVALLLLSKLGYRADVSNNGKEALDALEKQDYDVILMDMQMPEMDGMEATKRIRADFPAEKQPYIIAMTAHAMSGYRETCLEAGMNHYITKPVHRHHLKEALQDSIEFRQKQAGDN